MNLETEYSSLRDGIEELKSFMSELRGDSEYTMSTHHDDFFKAADDRTKQMHPDDRFSQLKLVINQQMKKYFDKIDSYY